MTREIEKSLLDIDFASLTRRTVPPAGFVMYQAAPGLNRLGPNSDPNLQPWRPAAAPKLG
jgi:hypothetical protein